MPSNFSFPLFTDNGKVREHKYLLSMSTQEREFLREYVKAHGIRDVATLVRRCIRESLFPSQTTPDNPEIG